MSQFDDYDNEFENGGDEPQSMSLMGGIAGGGALPGNECAISDGNESKKITQQSLIIGVTVTVVAFGALMAMRITQNTAGASSISPETQQFMDTMDAKIANLGNMADGDPLNPKNIRELFRDTAAIVAAIEDDPTIKQVPIDQVQMNPFTPVHAAPAKTVVVDDAAVLEAQRMAKLEELYGELTRLDIQSLVGGSRPRAFIGGDLYKLGDTLGSFTIKEIDNRKIVFEAEGFELRDGETPFILGMSRGDR